MHKSDLKSSKSQNLKLVVFRAFECATLQYVHSFAEYIIIIRILILFTSAFVSKAAYSLVWRLV